METSAQSMHTTSWCHAPGMSFSSLLKCPPPAGKHNKSKDDDGQGAQNGIT